MWHSAHHQQKAATLKLKDRLLSNQPTGLYHSISKDHHRSPLSQTFAQRNCWAMCRSAVCSDTFSQPNPRTRGSGHVVTRGVAQINMAILQHPILRERW